MKTVKIHHASVKLAAKLGLTLQLAGDAVEVVDKNGKVVASGATGREALAQILSSETTRETMNRLRGAKKPRKARKSRASDEDGEEGEGDDEGDEEEEGKSVVKQKYKTRYKPHKMTCGDPLSKQIRTEFMTIKDPDTKKMKMDWVRFTQFAKINGCWSDEYRKVNKGMRRMNIVNRLRALIKDGHKVVWSV